MEYNKFMATLINVNRHIRDPRTRRAMLVRGALDSSVFEGAQGLKSRIDRQRPARFTARFIASSKKRARCR